MGDQYEPIVNMGTPPPPPGENNQYEVPAFGGTNPPPPPPAPTPSYPPPSTPSADAGGKSEIKSEAKSAAKSGSEKSDKKRSLDKERGGKTVDEENQSNMSKVQSEIKQPTEEQELSTVAAAKKAQEIDKKDHLHKLRIKYVKRVKCGVCAATIILLIVCIAISIPCSLYAFNVVGNIFDDPPEESHAAAVAATTMAMLKRTTESPSTLSP